MQFFCTAILFDGLIEEYSYVSTNELPPYYEEKEKKNEYCRLPLLRPTLPTQGKGMKMTDVMVTVAADFHGREDGGYGDLLQIFLFLGFSCNFLGELSRWNVLERCHVLCNLFAI